MGAPNPPLNSDYLTPLPPPPRPGPVGGRLAGFYQNWLNITTDKFVLSVVSLGFRIPLAPDFTIIRRITVPPPRTGRPRGLSDRGFFSHCQTGHCPHFRQPRPLPIPSLHGPQKERKMEDDSKPKTNKPFRSRSKVQNGNTKRHPPPTSTRRLGGIYRPYRRLPPRPNPSGLKEYLRVCLQQSDLPLQGPPLRPKIIPVAIHKDRPDYCRLPQEGSDSSVLLPRRLAYRGSLPRPPSSTPASHTAGRPVSGLPCELRKVQPGALQASHLPRSQAGHCQDPSLPHTGAHSSDLRHHLQAHVISTVHCRGLAEVPGPPGLICRPHSECTSTYETFSVTPSSVLCSGIGPTHHSGPGPDRSDSTPSTLDLSYLSCSGQALLPSSSARDDLRRRVSGGLGSSPGERPGLRLLAESHPPSSHQPPRTSGSIPVSLSLPPLAQGQVCQDYVRQHHHGSLHKPSGRNEIPVPVSRDHGTLVLGYFPRHDAVSSPCPREMQHPGRSFIQEEPLQHGVVSSPISVSDHLHDLRHTEHRSVRVTDSIPATNLLLPHARSECMGDRRPVDPLGACDVLRLSPTSIDPSSPPEGSQGPSGGPPDRPFLAQEALVSPPPLPTPRRPEESPLSMGPLVPGSRAQQGVPPQPRLLAPNVVATFRQQGEKAGLSQEAAGWAAKHLRSSTRGCYDARARAFASWCSSKSIDPASATVGQVADFFLTLFKRGLSIHTLRGYRSAIGAIHRGFSDGSLVGNSIHLYRLFKSFFLARPPTKRLIPSWSLPTVLRALTRAPFEPLSEASFKMLTIKTTFLLAICSGQRCSAISALSIAPGHLRWENRGVRLIPHARFIAKNQTLSSPSVEIFIPRLVRAHSTHPDRLLCPIRCLKWYLSHAERIRPEGVDSLLIATTPPHNAISSATVSRWLRQAIEEAGPSALRGGPIRAHDTRALATSWALFNGAPVADIIRAAYWANSNTFIAKYLRDVLATEDGRFSRAALGAINSVAPGV